LYAVWKCLTQHTWREIIADTYGAYSWRKRLSVTNSSSENSCWKPEIC